MRPSSEIISPSIPKSAVSSTGSVPRPTTIPRSHRYAAHGRDTARPHEDAYLRPRHDARSRHDTISRHDAAPSRAAPGSARISAPQLFARCREQLVRRERAPGEPILRRRSQAVRGRRERLTVHALVGARAFPAGPDGRCGVDASRNRADEGVTLHRQPLHRQPRAARPRLQQGRRGVACFLVARAAICTSSEFTATPVEHVHLLYSRSGAPTRGLASRSLRSPLSLL